MTDSKKLELLHYLNGYLLSRMPEYKKNATAFEATIESQNKLFRSLLNIAPPMKLHDEFIEAQNMFLQEMQTVKGVVKISDLTPFAPSTQLYIWQGDITRLEADSIVNAANSALLGCFIPCHGCIDNAIHSQAGLELRNECHSIMEVQGHKEKTGMAKITAGYNLPSKHVIHTVGPIISGVLTDADCMLLSNAYRNCLELAISKELKNIVFCCISTGEFHFPNVEAASIAVQTVKNVLQETNSEIEVIFNVFKELDRAIYEDLLGQDC